MNRTPTTAGISQPRRPPFRFIVTVALLPLFLSACLPGRRAPITPTGPINASAIPAASPTAFAIETLRPVATGGPCVNDVTFVLDASIPDGTLIEPNEEFDKRWRVNNSGTCDWGPDYEMVRVSGPAMGAPDVSALYPAKAGAEVDIQIALSAPAEPGEYTTSWRMRDDQGELFGDVLFVTIVVPEPVEP